ncbi:energy transducer TonB [Rheinheimera sp.]|uniref:energy transducer TonB n=1 Tax=Rheinheimera sp. TaxID=1869214 RepID=UPI0027B95333|nr:energy transducer TonB [Rheinheimera sp.]
MKLFKSHWLIAVLVVAGHCLGLGVMLTQADTTTPKPVAPPTMVGLLLPPAPEQVVKQQPKQQPKPLPKPEPAKPKKRQPPKAKPLPKAPPSERAIQAPAPEPEVAKPVKTAPAKTAPQAAPAVQPPSAQAQGLQNRAPRYPQLSRKKKEQGTVLLKLLVKADGTVGNISVLKSSGFSRLDQAALQAVKHWRFVPAKQQGQSIDFWYEMPMTFALNQPG